MRPVGLTYKAIVVLQIVSMGIEYCCKVAPALLGFSSVCLLCHAATHQAEISFVGEVTVHIPLSKSVSKRYYSCGLPQ